VGGRKQVTITRAYKPVLDDCTKALALLLRVPVRKEAAHPAASNDAKKESKQVGARTSIHE
jgi:hypothetical protein